MTLRIALIGAGGIGVQHADALRSLGDTWHITHVCDLDRSLAEPIAKVDGAVATDDLDAVLAAPEVEVVDICLPPVLHVPVTLRALGAGKHVICEKPLAGSLAEIDKLRAAAMAANRQIFPVFQYRYGRAFRRLAALGRAGLLGAPRVASLDTHWDRDASYYSVAWRGSWAHEMGGAVLCHAIHTHDLLTLVFGPIAEVSALTDTMINPIETEDCAAIAMRMANGALVTSSITLGAAGNDSRLRLVYEHATVESARLAYTPGEADWTVTARAPEDQARIDAIVAQEGREGFAGYFEDVAAALIGAPNTAVSFDDGAASVTLATAIYSSSRTGSRVSLPLSPDAPLNSGWAPS